MTKRDYQLVCFNLPNKNKWPQALHLALFPRAAASCLSKLFTWFCVGLTSSVLDW